MSTRTGKIARLPHALREEVNRRLLDGQSSRVILAWLNKDPGAIAIWERDFEGVPASAQNLSTWKLEGWKDWMKRKERVENLKTLSTFANDLARAGGSIADGAAAILSGQILEALEEAANLVVTGGTDDAEKDPHDGLTKMATAVASLQKGQVAREKVGLEKERVKAKKEDQKLAREKFETQTAAKLYEYARSPEVQAILDSGKTKDAVLADLRGLMFGQRPGKEAA